MFSVKTCNRGTSFSYPSMIAKILNYFKIGMSNIICKSPGSSHEFSQHTLINMNYFWDIKCRVYNLRLGKHGRKIYKFDNLVEFGDDVEEDHMDDEQPMDAP